MERQVIEIADQQEITEAQERWRVLSELFAFLDREMVEYCVVGDHDKMCDGRDGDVDLVVTPSILKAMPRLLLRFAITNDARLMQSIKHETTAYFFVLAWRDANKQLHLLQLDTCSDYYRFGRKLMTSEELLHGRECVTLEDGADYYTAAGAPAFVYYMLKKVEKQGLDAYHGEVLSRLFASDRSGSIASHLRRYWADERIALIQAAAETGDWSSVQSTLPDLKTELHARLPNSFRARISEVRRKIGRILKPTGFFIAVFGPDGSGKSTVNEHVRSSLNLAFWGNEYVHLRPRLGVTLAESDKIPTLDPHGQEPRGWLSSVTKLLYYAFDYIAGYYVTVKPLLIRSKLVVFDRYFHDMMVDPRRYRYGGPEFLLRLVERFIPKPDLFLFLDAPAEVIQSRKTEVTFDETVRQREAYQLLARRLKSFRIVDASGELDNTLAEAEWVIVDRMADRVERRFWLR
jgi:thymidylate kinase